MFGVSYPDFRAYQAANKSFEGLEASSGVYTVIGEKSAPPERVNTGRVSSGMFEMFSTPPVLGRGFSINDGQSGAAPVGLISHRLWQSRYAGAYRCDRTRGRIRRRARDNYRASCPTDFGFRTTPIFGRLSFPMSRSKIDPTAVSSSSVFSGKESH